ncbi:MAG: tRNA (adenosine(37)-N6)-threonylcarbamoyltransferase complex ATPase subunit type 1 TsaE [Deltaproteobacteria bacterium]|nr:tRNA (adenosine(37)-N6)-threonylcarbamoyltransferase complex ATPase subunit type 1 TsaE [Deltaproteobacteria bacterium]
MATPLLEEIVKDEEATEGLGQSLASLFRPGDVIALYGELGAGKTCLVRGLAQGLGVEKEMVSSPSFSLINEYPGVIPLFHMDCYRLGLEEEIQELGLEEYFDGPGISIIEWAERVRDLPEERLEISISILDASRRRIQIKGIGSMINRLQDWNLKHKIRESEDGSQK